VKEYIAERVLEAAEYLLKTGATVRSCAKKFSVSKTTVHKDMRERLPQLQPEMARRVDEVLRVNLRERHIRGGMATRQKYRRIKEI
jgi:putative DeoR family transcriptional regulator (stage III sporulation protein D)